MRTADQPGLTCSATSTPAVTTTTARINIPPQK